MRVPPAAFRSFSRRLLAKFLLTAAAGGVPQALSAQALRQQTAKPVVTLPNVEALRKNTEPLPTIYLAGYEFAGDGGEGVFHLDPEDQTTADNGGTIIVDVTGRRYVRNFGEAAISVKWWGAKGDGVTDDRPAIQAALDYLLTFPQAVPKRLLLPRPAQFYRIGTLQSPREKFGPHSWDTTARFALMFPHAKNLTIEGDDGQKVRIVLDDVFSTPDDRVFGIDQEMNKPALYYDPSLPYYAALVATGSEIAPVEVGRNFVELSQGSLDDFPVGDLVMFNGTNLIAMYNKIVAVDEKSGRIFFERPINLKYGWTTFSAIAAADAGSNKIYVGSHIWFTRYFQRPEWFSIHVKLDDGNDLATTIVTASHDGLGSFITIKNTVPDGRFVPAGADITLLGNSGLRMVRSTKSFQRQCRLLPDTTDHPGPSYVRLDDPFWCVTPENIVLKNLQIEGGYFQVCGSHVYNLRIENCVLLSKVGEIFLLGVIQGFQIIDSEIRQLSTTGSGLQLTPASTRNVELVRSSFYGAGISIGECTEAVNIDSCTFVCNNHLALQSAPFMSLAQYRDISIRNSKILALGGWMASRESHGTLLLIGAGDSPYEVDTCIIEGCELGFQPGSGDAGIEYSNQYVLVTNNPETLILRNNLIASRNSAGTMSLVVNNLIYEGNTVNATDVSYGITLAESSRLGARNGLKVVRGNTFRRLSRRMSPSAQACWTFAWSEFAGPGYVTATFDDNIFDGYKAVFALAGSASDSRCLTDVLVRGQRSINSQPGFSWDAGTDSDALFELASIGPDGTRTWAAKIIDPAGGIAAPRDQIMYAGDGTTRMIRTCVSGGGLSRGSWNAAVNYAPNHWVTAADGSVYRALKESGPNSGVRPPPAASYWQRMADTLAIFHTECWGPGTPQVGSFRVGDVAWNTKPSAGGSAGWFCVQAGSPGVWKAFGPIER